MHWGVLESFFHFCGLRSFQHDAHEYALQTVGAYDQGNAKIDDVTKFRDFLPPYIMDRLNLKTTSLML